MTWHYMIIRDITLHNIYITFHYITLHYIHAYIHTSIHPYIHTSMHPHIHPSVHPYIHTCMHACMHTSERPPHTRDASIPTGRAGTMTMTGGWGCRPLPYVYIYIFILYIHVHMWICTQVLLGVSVPTWKMFNIFQWPSRRTDQNCECMNLVDATRLCQVATFRARHCTERFLFFYVLTFAVVVNFCKLQVISLKPMVFRTFGCQSSQWFKPWHSALHLLNTPTSRQFMWRNQRPSLPEVTDLGSAHLSWSQP